MSGPTSGWAGGAGELGDVGGPGALGADADDADGAPRWTIGAVARAARVTVAALRHYHEVGMLVPARVDPDTRYRYYSGAQVTEALRIGVLRQVGVPLDDLRALAGGRLGLDEVLARQRDRLRREIGARRQALAVLDGLAPDRRPGPGAPEPLGRVVAEQVGEDEVDSLRLDATWDTAATVTRRGLHRLALAQRRSGGAVGGDPGAVFPLDPADRFPLRVFRSAVGAPPPGAVRLRLAGGPVLAVELRAEHALLPLAYRSVLAEADRRGLVPVGPVVERYLPEAEPPPRTRVVVAVRGA